jgi:hypothetical protein
MKNSVVSNGPSTARSAGVDDPAFTPFAAASIEDIRRAQRLRERLRQRYPNRPSPRVAYWSVGAD